MLLVTTTDHLARVFGMEKTIEMIAEAGFDAIDFSAFYKTSTECPIKWYEWTLDMAKAMKAKADECGIPFVQAHSSFPSSWEGNDEYNSTIKDKIVHSMEFSAALGVETIVVHPIQHLDYSTNVEALYEMNMEFYRSLIPYCERYGIKVAVENLYQTDKTRGVCIDGVCANPQEFCRYIDDLNSEWITGCLDFAHADLCGKPSYDVLRQVGADRITALHVSDCDYIKDSHMIPYTRNMNWEEICKAIAETGYRGNFTYEADNFLKQYSPEFLSTALKFMHDTGRYIISKIESYRNQK